jgi:hypothetical protein
MEITLPLPDPAILTACCIMGALAILVGYIAFVYTRRDDEDGNFILVLVLTAFAVALLCVMVLLAGAALTDLL